MGKTAFQALKHNLETVYKESYKLRQSDYENGRADMLDLVIQWVDEAIPEERQQIEDAWNNGFYGVGNSGSTYYQSKYTESKGE